MKKITKPKGFITLTDFKIPVLYTFQILARENKILITTTSSLITGYIKDANNREFKKALESLIDYSLDKKSYAPLQITDRAIIIIDAEVQSLTGEHKFFTPHLCLFVEDVKSIALLSPHRLVAS